MLEIGPRKAPANSETGASDKVAPIGRLLIVGPYPPPFGGVASQIANTIPGIARGGVSAVHVLAAGLQDGESSDGPASIRRVNLRNHWRTAVNPNAIARTCVVFSGLLRSGLELRRALAETVRFGLIARTIETQGINLIHFFLLTDATLAPFVRRFYPRVYIATTIYGEIFDFWGFFQSRSTLVASIMAASDSLMSSSRYCARSVEALQLPSDRITPIYYGVDLDRFSPEVDGQAFRTREGVSPTMIVVMFLGRLVDQMGADAFARLIPRVLSTRRDVVFVVAGASGSLVPEFKELLRNYPEELILRVDPPASALPEMYAACDVFVAPSRDKHPCMGMSIKEAMATGRAVVASATGGIPEAVLEGETGLLLPVREGAGVSPEDLEGAINQLIENPALRKKMGWAGRLRAEKMFDNNRTVTEVLRQYRMASERRVRVVS